MNVNTEDWREIELEQVAAYIGHQPWREFSALKKDRAELERTKAELAEARAGVVRLRKALALLDSIAYGSEEPSGNEPEDICQIVESIVKTRRENARLREAGEALADITPTNCGGDCASVMNPLCMCSCGADIRTQRGDDGPLRAYLDKEGMMDLVPRELHAVVMHYCRNNIR